MLVWILAFSQEHHIFLFFFSCIVVQILAVCGALVRIIATTQACTFATLQKTPLLSIVTYEILTRAGPKNHPKNLSFFWNRVLEGRGGGGGSRPAGHPVLRLRRQALVESRSRRRQQKEEKEEQGGGSSPDLPQTLLRRCSP